jgi:hypothetical protein
VSHFTEIQPWGVGGTEEARALAGSLSTRIGGCKALESCLDSGLDWFTENYARLGSEIRRGLVSPPAGDPKTTQEGKPLENQEKR